MSEIIRLDNVVKMVNDQRIVNGVSFTIHEGEHVQVCGGDERGRAMLMKLIAGMERPSDGEIFVMGEAIHKMGADKLAAFRNQTFGVCLREPSFMPSLTVWENVALPLMIRGVDVLKRERAAKEQLKQLGIRQIAYAYPAQLKPQEAQIVSLTRAMITHPPVLLLEELTAGLSEKQTGQVTDALHAAVTEATIIHFTSEEDVPGAQRRLILDHGQLREETI
jgi:predicted ABC-type transport system involved in lysophospholipase L1 biosynthesis ATPase subunit